MTLEDVILIFLRDLKTKLCKHNQKEVEWVHYIKVYAKGVLSCLCGNFWSEFTLSIAFKAIDSPERLWPKIHPRYFTFPYCLISVLLYKMFKALAFRCLFYYQIKLTLFCLGQNVYLIHYQQTSHTNMKNLLVVSFQFQLHFLF